MFVCVFVSIEEIVFIRVHSFSLCSMNKECMFAYIFFFFAHVFGACVCVHVGVCFHADEAVESRYVCF